MSIQKPSGSVSRKPAVCNSAVCGRGDICFGLMAFFFAIVSEKSRSRPQQITATFRKAKKHNQTLAAAFVFAFRPLRQLRMLRTFLRALRRMETGLELLQQTPTLVRVARVARSSGCCSTSAAPNFGTNRQPQPVSGVDRSSRSVFSERALSKKHA